jgi:C4-dicarboxylate transporter/malic acid transport protein
MIQTFQTKWFMMPMATGAMGMFTYLLRGVFPSGMTALALFFVLFALLMFGAMGVMFVWRLVRFPQALVQDAAHPIEVNFFAAISIAASVVSTTVSRVLVPTGLLSQNSGMYLAGLLYGIGVVLGLIFLWMTLYKLTLSDKVELPHAVGIWLLPPVGLFVSVFAGNFWATFLSESTAHTVLVINLLIFGIAFVTYLFVMGMIFQRKKLQPLPPAILAPSFFVPLAPPGVLVIALWSFVARIGSIEAFGSVQSVFVGGTVLFSGMMIGFGLFWLVYAALVARRYEKIPFSLGYWAYVFPVNAFGISIVLSAHHPLLAPLSALTLPLWALGLVLWVFVFYKTTMAIKAGAFKPKKD